MVNNTPNFLIVGAAKSGTTALTNLLRQHPELFIPGVKEPRYFAADALRRVTRDDPQYDFIQKNSVLNRDNYYELFHDTDSFTCRGETSVHYLFHHKQVIPKIIREVGNIKILIILRNPATRALSNFYYMKKETLSFKEALQKERGRMKMGYNSFWYYRQLGCYHDQVKAYLDNFTNVKIVIFSDFKNAQKKTCGDIFSFLGISSDYGVNTDIDKNITRVPKSNLRKQLLKFESSLFAQKILLPLFGRWLKEYKKTFLTQPNYYKDTETYNDLVDYFMDDIIKLEKLLNVNLDRWKQKI